MGRWEGLKTVFDWALWQMAMVLSVKRGLRQGLVSDPVRGEELYMRIFGLPRGMPPEDIGEYTRLRAGSIGNFAKSCRVGLTLAGLIVRRRLREEKVIDLRSWRETRRFDG